MSFYDAKTHPKENDADLLSRNAAASKGAGNDTFDQKP